MAVAKKDSRYRWKDGEEAKLVEYVDSRAKEGVSVTSALKEYSREKGISWLTARWKYYQVKRKTQPHGRTEAEADSPRESEPKVSAEDDFLGSLSCLVDTLKGSGEDVVPFMRGLSRMALLAREAMSAGSRLNDLQRERDHLWGELERTRERIRALREDVKKHLAVVEDWLALSQVDKVSALKDFAGNLARERDRLAGTLDKVSEL